MESTQQSTIPLTCTYDNQIVMQQHLENNNMTIANNLNGNSINRPMDELSSELRQQSTTAQPQFTSNFIATSNLSLATAENSASSLSTQHHQYHYIQYPPYYHAIGMNAQIQQQQQQQQEQEQQLQTPFMSAQQLTGDLTEIANACHCHCSCGAQQQRQQQLLQQRHYQQYQQRTFFPSIGQKQHHQQQQQQQHAQQDSGKVVVQVHCQSNGETDCDRELNTQNLTKKTQSEQSLLNHSYQTLQLQTSTGDEDKPLNVLHNSKLNISCDCDLECTCGADRLRSVASESIATTKHNKTVKAKSDDFDANVLTRPMPLKNQKQCQIDAMLGVDEITVSESDNNSTMIKKKKKTVDSCSHSNTDRNSWCQNSTLASDMNCDCHYNSSHNEIYSDGDTKGGHDSIDDQRPPLPPRPPPPPRLRNATITGNGIHRPGSGIKKYVVWCLICGGISCLLGILFLGVYFLLHSYTITVGNFETVPTFVPATLLILTGICIMSLARRRNRYSYLIKLSGVCGIISALTCALVTVTTTVLHMSRLQALRECEYAQKTRTCTCYSDMIESQVDRVDKGVRLVFDSLSDCGVVHGSLYSCLRAIFGLSVAGVLVAVFSCMLVYQLLSHERKKMYWEQLELRCRSLYTSQQGPPPNMAALTAAGRSTMCRCCEQCHLHRQVPLQATAYPWDDSGEPRFWTGQPPGNFYSPNPGGDDLHNMAGMGTACRGHSGPSSARSRTTGWSWPRMPWQRNSPVTNARQFRQTPSSPDSQYGFTNNAPSATSNNLMSTAADVSDSTAAAAQNSTGPQFNVVGGGLPYGVWGPPPPYSDPNSPARRGYYHYIQPNACSNNITTMSTNNMNHSTGNMSNENTVSIPTEQRLCLNHRSVFLDQQPHNQLSNNNVNNCCANLSMRRNLAKRRTTGGCGGGNGVGGGGISGGVGGGVGSSDSEEMLKTKNGVGEYENTPSDSDGFNIRDRFSNTLPARKGKKRNDVNIKLNGGGNGVGANPHPAPRLSIQKNNAKTEICDRNANDEEVESIIDDSECMEHIANNGICGNDDIITASSRNNGRSTLRCKRGVENNALKKNSEAMTSNESDAIVHGMGDPAESEVYFADVSSCCNMSLKNDSYYDEAHQPTAQLHSSQHHHHPHHHQHQQTQPHLHQHLHQHQNSNCSQNSSSNNEDYLSQRFGQRENSIRSRLPFPQIRNNEADYEKNLNSLQQKDIGCGSVTPVNLIQKDISCQSMCSMESEAQTECTDLSPATPCSNKFAQTTFETQRMTTTTTATMTTSATTTLCDAGNETNVLQQNTTVGSGSALPNFVAKFPYSSESQSLEAHRRSTKDIQDLILASETHYETINDNPQQIQSTTAPQPPCQFTTQQPNARVSKPQAQRPTNLSSSMLANKTKTKHTSKIRDRIEANVMHVDDRDWPNANLIGSVSKCGGIGGIGGGGGGNSDRKCL